MTRRSVARLLQSRDREPDLLGELVELGRDRVDLGDAGLREQVRCSTI